MQSSCSKVNGELSQAQLEAARLGFIKYLRRKRFSPHFIDNHAEDLFATATLEYSRKLTEGALIERPGGWLIDCAWKRTKSLLEAQQRRPHLVSSEKSEEVLADEDTPTPEEIAMEEDRLRKVHEAVAQLSEDERRFLAHAYFEGIAVREVARQLGWHPSKAQRFHESARRRLHELLGVDSVDDLVVEIGVAAYVSIAAERSSGLQVRAGGEAVLDLAARGASEVWARAQELARRLPLGGSAEPSTAAVLGGTAGRAAGVCATAAAACLAATGVVGPGIGGVSSEDERAEKPTATRERLAEAPSDSPLIPKLRTAAPTREPELQEPEEGERSAGSATATASQRRQERAGQAVRSQSVESVATGSDEEIESAPVQSAPSTEVSEPTSSVSSSSSPNPTEVANEQFAP